MPADDPNLLDVLSSVPRNAKQYSDDVANYIEKQFDMAAEMTRKILSSEWIPEPARRRPPPPPKPAFVPVSTSIFSKAECWVYRHKILTAVMVVVLGGVTYKIIKHHIPRKKRRARRAAVTNARVEVVILAASPSEPITRSIALDLERRGFIVYILCNSAEEEVLVHNESRHDIKPLHIDATDPTNAKEVLESFARQFQSEQRPFHGARPHYLNLRSLILIPSLTYPSSPVAALSPSTLSDLLNSRLLHPILTLQTFLPLFTTLTTSPNPEAILNPPPPPSILVLTPSIIPSLCPAFHSTESTIVSALTSFTRVLSNELAPLNIPVSHLQLGTFDFWGSVSKSRGHAHNLRESKSETDTWENNARKAYEKNFLALNLGLGNARGCGSHGNGNGITKGSSLRVLNDRIFDVMTSGKGGVVRVGMGSSIYNLIGSCFPHSLVSWMLGMRRSKQDHILSRGRSGRASLLLTPAGSDSENENKEEGGRGPDVGFSASDGDEKDCLSVYGAMRDLEGEDAWRRSLEMPDMSELRRGSGRQWDLGDATMSPYI